MGRTGQRRPAAAVPGRLVAELTAEFSQASIGKRSGQPPVTQHAGHVELFDYYDAMFGSEAGRELVHRVEAKVGGAAVDSGEPAPSVVPPP